MAVFAFQAWVETIAKMQPEALINFQPTQETLDRVQELVDLNNAGQLSPDEELELNNFFYLENMFGLTD